MRATNRRLRSLRPNNKIVKVGIIFGLVLIVAFMGFLFWYNVALSPAQSKEESKLVTISPGSTPKAIGELLQDEGIIRNSVAFRLYARLNGVQSSLQAGSYELSPSYNVPQIVGYLKSGKVNSLNITFLPGATLEEHKKVLKKAGYSEQEINVAFTKKYSSPLLESKPDDADLEGYIYGETYSFNAGENVETILETVFDHYYKVLARNNLIKIYQSKGLSLHEAIILASIIQREAIGGEEPQVAQVFFTRLERGMPLGSDPTYQYIADKLGLKRSTMLDNPYNTRIYPGLPPGPISSPGEASLLAVANPADTDYTFFLHGDDDKPYFSHSLEEHEANIKKHCQKKCLLL